MEDNPETVCGNDSCELVGNAGKRHACQICGDATGRSASLASLISLLRDAGHVVLLVRRSQLSIVLVVARNWDWPEGTDWH